MIFLLRDSNFLQKCSNDVFIEGLLVPALRNEEFALLEDQLLIIDPTLNQWHSYLTASCRHLQKSKYYNVLYSMQVFMKVCWDSWSHFLELSRICYEFSRSLFTNLQRRFLSRFWWSDRIGMRFSVNCRYLSLCSIMWIDSVICSDEKKNKFQKLYKKLFFSSIQFSGHLSEVTL